MHHGYGKPIFANCFLKGNTEDDRNKLIGELNSILQKNFDYVPIGKVVNIVDELIEKGWNFEKK